MRVLKPGGVPVVVDNNRRAGDFADLLAGSTWAVPQGQAAATDAWWSARGADRVEVMSRWPFETRADFEAVLHLEFPADIADRRLAAHPAALGLTYGYVLFAARKAPIT